MKALSRVASEVSPKQNYWGNERQRGNSKALDQAEGLISTIFNCQSKIYSRILQTLTGQEVGLLGGNKGKGPDTNTSEGQMSPASMPDKWPWGLWLCQIFCQKSFKYNNPWWQTTAFQSRKVNTTMADCFTSAKSAQNIPTICLQLYYDG